MLTDEQLEILVESGRQLASSLLSDVIRTADDEEQLRNQTGALYIAAVHIVATELYNRVLQSEEMKNFELTFAQVIKEIRAEFNFLKSGENGVMQLLGPGGKKEA